MTGEPPPPHRRRARYAGKHPRRFDEKYKEHDPERYPETVRKVLDSGKTPAGAHVPILTAEILEALDPRPGETAVDCTIGYGGHARAMLERLQPGGKLLGLDVDPLELPKAEARMRRLGFGPDVFAVRRSNFAGLPAALAAEGLAGADCLLADLGVSSMQLDTPGRGFSFKTPGPLDMRMNPNRGQPASALLRQLDPEALAALLVENGDEPHAAILADALAGRGLELTSDLATAVRSALADVRDDEREQSVRRVFQALRIAVNEEYTALETLLRHLPQCMNPGGRVAIVAFHSGEDRRVKKAFQAGLRDGLYAAIADTVVRPTPGECRANPRASAAKLRWARRPKTGHALPHTMQEQRHVSYARIADKLRHHDIIILDGGTGTDIQRRGARMSGDTWCADANLTHPDIVRAVHRDYVRAGADIITANTFATSPILFSHIGRLDDVARIDAVAMALAREATAGTAACVAGSMSTMRPMAAGTDRNNLNFELGEREARALFQAKAKGLEACGCDLIMMELMRDTDYAVWASEAALATGLPVWIGLSAERGNKGTLQGWGRDDCSFDEIARTLAALEPAVMMVMHTSPDNTDEALAILRRHWTGPIATYPECGYFKSPDWEFIDVIPPAELVRKSHGWQHLGASIFGGCCGTGPDHVAALTREFKTP